MSYADLEEFRDFLRVYEEEDTADDVQLQLALDSASDTIDQHCNQRFVPGGEGPGVWYGDAVYNRKFHRYEVRIPALFDVGTVLVETDDGNLTYAHSYDETELRFLPLNAFGPGGPKPYRSILLPSNAYASCQPGSVKVTASFGWGEPPDCVKQACLLQASRYLKRREAPFGVAGSPELGNELRLLTKLDPDVKVLLRSVMNWWVVG